MQISFHQFFSWISVYFEKKFYLKELDWRVIGILRWKVATNTYLRSFLYKKLNSILYLNEKIFVVELYTSFCSFCNSFGGNITHLFCDCIITQYLGKKLQLKLKENITLPLTPQAAIFGFLEADCQCHFIQNHIFLNSKLYTCKSRKRKFLSSTSSLKEISKIKNMENKVASVNEKKSRRKESGEKLKTN